MLDYSEQILGPFKKLHFYECPAYHWDGGMDESERFMEHHFRRDRKRVLQKRWKIDGAGNCEL